MDASLGKSLVDSGLVSSERAATLQHQGNAFEREAMLMSCEVWSKLKVHWVLSC
jgi:hypothetical protein